MADERTLKKLEEWKEKYYAAVSEQEKQNRYRDSLEKGLRRLALASQGLDRELDKHLGTLREALRKGSTQSKLENMLKNIEQAIAAMEETRQATVNFDSDGAILAQMLREFKPPKSHRDKVNALINQADKAKGAALEKVVKEIGLCLDDIITQARKGSRFSLFSRQKDSKDSKDSGKAAELSPAEASADALLRLLERLSLPPDISEKTNQLRDRLTTALKPAELPQVIEELADIINALGTQVISDKQEYGDFLQNLAKQIEALDENLRDSREGEKTAFAERQALGERVESEVTSIRQQVDEATDFDELKNNLEERLQDLAKHVEDYRHADLERHERADQQIEELSHRLSTMEQEAGSLRDAIRKSRDMALKDALTGIWNRQAFNEALDREFARWQRYRKPLTVVMWDIDWFKRINDTYGHGAGDKALQAIAQIFQRGTRTTDFIARYGGEEFVGLLPETTMEAALTMTNNLRVQIETSEFHYEKKPIPITASAGLACFDRDDDTPESVLKRADKALYQAKEERNRCIALPAA